jgi:hypothetical protein
LSTWPPVRFVPSLCEYTGARWHPEHDEVVYYSQQRIAELADAPFAHKSTGTDAAGVVKRVVA